MTIKQRLSVTVDPDTLAAAEKAVADGEAASLSAWVNDALRIKLEQGRRLTALSAFIEEYEGLHGEITDAEMAFAARRVRGDAIVVRGSRGRQKNQPRRKIG